MESARSVQPQARDLELMSDLLACRVMSLAQATALHFDGRKEAAKKRIQKLKDAGLIRERSRRIGEPSLLHLTTAGFLSLQESGKTDQYPQFQAAVFEKRAQVSDLTLKHELEVMDVRVALVRALAQSETLSIAEFSTWPALNQFTVISESAAVGNKEVSVKPDGFLRVRERAEDGQYEHMFFIEVDRSTEVLNIVCQKAACYLQYYQSGGMAVRLGGKREDFRDYPFRVLMLFRSEERRNNVAERLLSRTPPILTQVWLSTVPALIQDPLGEIWIRPKEYQSTMHERGLSLHETHTDRRNMEHQRMIGAQVLKRALF